MVDAHGARGLDHGHDLGAGREHQQVLVREGRHKEEEGEEGSFGAADSVEG